MFGRNGANCNSSADLQPLGSGALRQPLLSAVLRASKPPWRLWRCWRAGRRRCRKGVSSFSVSAASACAIKIPTGQLKYKVIEPYSVSFELPVLSALIAHVGSSALHILQDVVVVGLTSTSSNAVASASAAAVACYQLRLRHQMCRLQRSHQHRCRCWQGRDCGHRRDLRTSTSTAARASKAYIICSSAAGHI